MYYEQEKEVIRGLRCVLFMGLASFYRDMCY